MVIGHELEQSCHSRLIIKFKVSQDEILPISERPKQFTPYRKISVVSKSVEKGASVNIREGLQI